MLIPSFPLGSPPPPWPVVNRALRDLRRQERGRWRHIRDPRLEPLLERRLAVTLVQHAAARDSTNSATVQVTISATGAGNLLIALTRGDSGAGNHHASSCKSGASHTFTQFAGAAFDGTGGNAGVNHDCFYLLSSVAGDTTITATFDAVAAYVRDLFVFEVSGFTTPATDGTNGLNGTAGGAGSVVMTGAGVTTAGLVGFLAALCSPGNNVVLNPNTGNEFSAGGDNPNGNGSVSLISASAATHTPAWTSDTVSDAFVTFTVAFKETAGATVAQELAAIASAQASGQWTGQVTP